MFEYTLEAKSSINWHEPSSTFFVCCLKRPQIHKAQGPYGNGITEFQDFFRTIPVFFSFFNNSISS